jgi:hypothetical protein
MCNLSSKMSRRRAAVLSRGGKDRFLKKHGVEKEDSHILVHEEYRFFVPLRPDGPE